MKNWWKALGKVRGHSWLAIKITAVLFLIKMGLLMLPFDTFKKWYAMASSTNSSARESNETVVWLIKGISHYLPFGFNCLPQALCLKYVMRNDSSLELIVGVNNEEGFKAHAWVEKQKKYLIGDLPFENFTPIWTWK